MSTDHYPSFLLSLLIALVASIPASAYSQELIEQIRLDPDTSAIGLRFLEMGSVDDPEQLLKREPTIQVVYEPTERFKPSGEQKDHAHKVPAGTVMHLGGNALLPTRAKKTCFSMCMRVNLQGSLSPQQAAGAAPNDLNPVKGEEKMRDSQCQKLCVKTTVAVVKSIGSTTTLPRTDNGIAGTVTYNDHTRKEGGGMVDSAVFDPAVSSFAAAPHTASYSSRKASVICIF